MLSVWVVCCGAVWLLVGLVYELRCFVFWLVGWIWVSVTLFVLVGCFMSRFGYVWTVEFW